MILLLLLVLIIINAKAKKGGNTCQKRFKKKIKVK